MDTERRISPRTKTRLRMTLRRGALVLKGRCVELSHSGLLVELPDVPSGIWPYESITLDLPGGRIHAVTRRVTMRGNRLALAITQIEDGDQELLTDFLFERMLRDSGRARLRPRAPRRPRLRAVA